MSGDHPETEPLAAAASAAAAGPLAGIRILEIEGIGPGPFAAMLLCDLGANVLRISRPPGSNPRVRNPVLERGRSGTLRLDLKSPADHGRLLRLIDQADALLEGFRPGVMERLNLGPQTCLSRNPRLVYGRMTGWGQTGPLAKTAGHDINYIALSGALYACGTRESGPVPPLNLVGDFGGGGLLLALGMLAALFERHTSGLGQVVDSSVLAGSGVLMSMIYGLRANGQWPAARAGNLLDGSAYFYRCYACACGGWMAVGAIEHNFRRVFLQKLGLEAEAPAILARANDDPGTHARIAGIFRAQTRRYWEEVFCGLDACVSPVLGLDEITSHPHNRAEGFFEMRGGALHPEPAPRFSRTPPLTLSRRAEAASARLAEWDLSP